MIGAGLWQHERVNLANGTIQISRDSIDTRLKVFFKQLGNTITR
jgi:hypothetical protein